MPSSGPGSVGSAVDPTTELARCFLRLVNLPNYALDRLSRYDPDPVRLAKVIAGRRSLSASWLDESVAITPARARDMSTAS